MTYPDLFVLGTGGEVFAVWTEAYTSDVEVSSLVGITVDQCAGTSYLSVATAV